jgi:hypothetical protein
MSLSGKFQRLLRVDLSPSLSDPVRPGKVAIDPRTAANDE